MGEVTFCGACGSVTGSSTLLRWGDVGVRHIIVDIHAKAWVVDRWWQGKVINSRQLGQVDGH